MDVRKLPVYIFAWYYYRERKFVPEWGEEVAMCNRTLKRTRKEGDEGHPLPSPKKSVPKKTPRVRVVKGYHAYTAQQFLAWERGE